MSSSSWLDACNSEWEGQESALPSNAINDDEQFEWFDFSPVRGMTVAEPTVVLAGDTALGFPGMVSNVSTKAQATNASKFAPKATNVTPLMMNAFSDLPEQAMLLSQTNFSVAILADSRAGAAAQANAILSDVKQALFERNATLQQGDSKFAIVASVYDPRTYASVSFEVAVCSPSETPALSGALSTPSSFTVDVTRHHGDAFFFGGLYSELKRITLTAAAGRLGASGGDGEVPQDVTRSIGDANMHLAQLPALQVPCFDQEAVPSAPQRSLVEAADEEIDTDTGSECLGISQSAHSTGAGKDELDAPVLQRAVSADAAASIAQLLRIVTDLTAGDVASDAACVLCELVTSETKFGTQLPTPQSNTSALMSSAAHMRCLAGALDAVAANPCCELFMPLAIATANALAAMPPTGGLTAAGSQLRRSLQLMSETPFSRTPAVPASVRAKMVSAL
jgi:hypothetical protein